MLLASVTMLNIEEDRVIEVDDAALLKTDCDKARLAPQLASLETIHTKQLFKAIDRWHGALEGVTSDQQKVIPTEWKEKALNEYDQSYVDSKILVQSLITGLGSEYTAASSWLLSLTKIPYVYAELKKRRKIMSRPTALSSTIRETLSPPFSPTT